jgi:hypothetical protein
VPGLGARLLNAFPAIRASGDLRYAVRSGHDDATEATR